MAKIHELPILERPREKALRYGIDSLSNYELIALLIESGNKEESALDIAYSMISSSGGLYNLITKPVSDLYAFKGIGKAKAMKISACFELAKRFPSIKQGDQEVVTDSAYLFDKYFPKLSNSNQEVLYLIILDKKKSLLHEINLYKGNESSVSISIKQIVKQVLIHSGRYFYVIHNHPSGSLEPSQEDLFFTSELIRESKKLNIILLDHIIISKEGYYEFMERKVHKNIN